MGNRTPIRKEEAGSNLCSVDCVADNDDTNYNLCVFYCRLNPVHSIATYKSIHAIDISQNLA